MTYIHERKDWPRFTWRVDALAELLSAVRYQQGLLLGRMRALGYPLQKEATLAALTEETVKSSAIEGEVLNPESVRSSLARRMGLSVAGAAPIDRHIEGIAFLAWFNGSEEIELLIKAGLAHLAYGSYGRCSGFMSDNRFQCTASPVRFALIHSLSLSVRGGR